jgi:hypothetical protein
VNKSGRIEEEAEQVKWVGSGLLLNEMSSPVLKWGTSAARVVQLPGGVSGLSIRIHQGPSPRLIRSNQNITMASARCRLALSATVGLSLHVTQKESRTGWFAHPLMAWAP